MASEYRCRKCRSKLFNHDSLINCHHQSICQESNEKLEDNCFKKTSNILFVDERLIDPWIKEQIDSGEWIKGRLNCPTNQCGARLGSFNFIKGQYCPCGQFELPSIQFNRSKVDEPSNNTNSESI